MRLFDSMINNNNNSELYMMKKGMFKQISHYLDKYNSITNHVNNKNSEKKDNS